MHKRRWALTAALFLLVSIAGIAPAPAADDVTAAYEKVQPSLVKVWAHDASGTPTDSGSGFVIVSDAHSSIIVTAAHVVKDAARVTIDVDRQAHDIPAQIVGSVTDSSDIALLTVERGDLKPVLFSSAARTLRPGNFVAVAGFLKRDAGIGVTGQAPSLRYGTVSSLQDGKRLLEVVLNVEEGLSGAPVFDPVRGVVVGMVQSRSSDGQSGYAVSAPFVMLDFFAGRNIRVAVEGPAAAPPAGLVVASNAAAPTNVRSYRYGLTTISCEARFAGDVGLSARGQTLRVESDDQGRPIRISGVRGGRIIGERILHYPAGSNCTSSSESFSDGQPIVETKIQRDSLGRANRMDYYSMDGALSSYTLYSYDGNDVEVANYAAAGNPTSPRLVRHFSETGTLVSERAYPPDGNVFYETEFDMSTGQVTSRKKVVADRIEVTYKPRYDADGDVIREDLYARDGRWFGSHDFSERLLVRKFVQFANGETRESRISYNAQRWPNQATFWVNGRLICTFMPDRNATGRIIRTRAIGAGGELLAEYPDAWIVDVERNGRAIDGNGGIIHRPGNWW